MECLVLLHKIREPAFACADLLDTKNPLTHSPKQLRCNKLMLVNIPDFTLPKCIGCGSSWNNVTYYWQSFEQMVQQRTWGIFIKARFSMLRKLLDRISRCRSCVTSIKESWRISQMEIPQKKLLTKRWASCRIVRKKLLAATLCMLFTAGKTSYLGPLPFH